MGENAHSPIDGGTVLVTGASAGIGRELALQLAPRARALVLRQAARSAARLRGKAKGAANAPDRPEGQERA